MPSDVRVLATVGLGSLVLYGGYQLWKRKAAAQLDCEKIANRDGGTIQDPCPTNLGLTDIQLFCGSEDFHAWQSRLSMQIAALATLRTNLEARKLIDQNLDARFLQYMSQATPLVHTEPWWTLGESKVQPFTDTLVLGCNLLNDGNMKLFEAGHREDVVSENPQAAEYASSAYPVIPRWVLLVLLAGLAAGGAYYIGFQSAL